MPAWSCWAPAACCCCAAAAFCLRLWERATAAPAAAPELASPPTTSPTTAPRAAPLTPAPGVVPVAGTEDGNAASTAIDAAPVVEDTAVNGVFVWVAGAALLLAGLGGGYAIATRNRRKGAVAG